MASEGRATGFATPSRKFEFYSQDMRDKGLNPLPDFVPTEYKILLENSVFTVLAPGPLPLTAFHVGIFPTSPAQKILYTPDTGDLYYDSDGKTPENDRVRFATLPSKPTLTYADFVVQ